jgi:hypothetical protein
MVNSEKLTGTAGHQLPVSYCVNMTCQPEFLYFAPADFLMISVGYVPPLIHRKCGFAEDMSYGMLRLIDWYIVPEVLEETQFFLLQGQQ